MNRCQRCVLLIHEGPGGQESRLRGEFCGQRPVQWVSKGIRSTFSKLQTKLVNVPWNGKTRAFEVIFASVGNPQVNL